MNNLRKLALLFTTLLAFEITAQTTKEVIGFNHIESIATDGQFLYLGDIGKKLRPTEKDGDGNIIKTTLNGEIVDSNSIKEKLNAPKGLAISNGMLFMADIDRIVAIELTTGNTLYSIDLSKSASFLNDIAVWDKNTLYVTATDKSTIFKVNLLDKTYKEVKFNKTIAGTNGIFCDTVHNRIYVNGFGSNNEPNGIIGYINTKTNQFTQIPGIKGYFDGIYLYNGILYVSNWIALEKKGIIQAIQLSNNKVSVIKMPEPIAGPADFIVANNRLIVPGLLSGTIHFIDLK